jgi:hypothetical protein
MSFRMRPAPARGRPTRINSAPADRFITVSDYSLAFEGSSDDHAALARSSAAPKPRKMIPVIRLNARFTAGRARCADSERPPIA